MNYKEKNDIVNRETIYYGVPAMHAGAKRLGIFSPKPFLFSPKLFLGTVNNAPSGADSGQQTADS